MSFRSYLCPSGGVLAVVLGLFGFVMPGIDNWAHGGGLVFGIDADAEDLRFPSLYRIDVMRSLFGDKAATAEQSEVGKFQTRAAEKFGGPYSGVFNQPK